MKIAVYGTGYVGLVTGACLSDYGNEVTCIDIDRTKIRKLNNASVTFFEPGLEGIVKKNIQKERLYFSSEIKSLDDFDLVFIAVGTPQSESGAANLDYVYAVAREIRKTIRQENKKINGCCY